MNPKPLWVGLGVALACVAQTLPAQSGDSLAAIRAQAENGNAQSQYEWGEAFFRGELGVARDEAEAAKWFRKAAEQNLAEAQYNLGVCYAKGQGLAKNAVEAVAWYRKAAVQNLAPAQYNLGVCYSKGRGVEEDPAEAVAWYRKAAKQRDAKAQYNLGVCYENGRGVAQDAAEAVKWYRKATAQNLAEAQYNLGVCYALGNGVAKDPVEACKWWTLAAAQGAADAETNRIQLESGMSPEQIAEAKQRATSWLEQRQKASAAMEIRVPNPAPSER